MPLKSFSRPSDRQIEAAGGDTDAARKRMLDWNVVARDEGVTRIASGDFAVVPGGKWKHAPTAEQRGLPTDTPLDGGEVGASAVRDAVASPEGLRLRGPELIRFVSNRLLLACLEGDPRGLPKDPEQARAVLRGDRQFAPTGYLAVADLHLDGRGGAEVALTQVGDVYVALDTAGRVPRVLEGSLEERAYAGEVILGKDKEIDVFKGELKKWIAARHPDVSDQYFYDLIFDPSRWATDKSRHAFFPTHKGDLQVFNAAVTEELRRYACATYAARGLTPEIFDAMIAKGMTPWQQNVAQNNPDAGPFWYPALDAVGDTPEQGISTVRFRLERVTTMPHPRLTVWTDGSVPKNPAGISIDTLKGLNAYGERTETEIDIGG